MTAKRLASRVTTTISLESALTTANCVPPVSGVRVALPRRAKVARVRHADDRLGESLSPTTIFHGQDRVVTPRCCIAHAGHRIASQIGPSVTIAEAPLKTGGTVGGRAIEHDFFVDVRVARGPRIGGQ